MPVAGLLWGHAAIQSPTDREAKVRPAVAVACLAIRPSFRQDARSALSVAGVLAVCPSAPVTKTQGMSAQAKGSHALALVAKGRRRIVPLVIVLPMELVVSFAGDGWSRNSNLRSM